MTGEELRPPLRLSSADESRNSHRHFLAVTWSSCQVRCGNLRSTPTGSSHLRKKFYVGFSPAATHTWRDFTAPHQQRIAADPMSGPAGCFGVRREARGLPLANPVAHLVDVPTDSAIERPGDDMGTEDFPERARDSRRPSSHGAGASTRISTPPLTSSSLTATWLSLPAKSTR